MLAGFYQADADGERFAIITEPTDDVVKPIHDRIPVRVPERLVMDWLSDAERARELLDTATVSLRREETVEQMSLWEE